MKTPMALFGLLWLLRLRDEIYGCPICEERKRKIALRRILSAPPPPVQTSAYPGAAGHPEATEEQLVDIELQQLTRNIAVQTDFDDGPEDLDKIEVEEEDHDASTRTTCSIECEREIKAILLNNNRMRRNIANLRSDSENEEAIWESLEVTLERGRNGLGLYIAGGDEGSDVIISRLDVNASDKAQCRLRIGDIIERVNDISVENGPHSFAVDTLQRAGHYVKIKVRRPRTLLVVTLYRGACGLGLGIAGGADNPAGGGIFISHIYPGSCAHYDGRLKVGDKILAVRDQFGEEMSLIEATHAQAVAVLRNAGDRVTLVVLPAAFIAPLNRPTLQRLTRSQATSCSTLDKIIEEEADEIPGCVRIVKLVRSGSRLGMDIVGGVGGDGPPGSADEPCGVFVSRVMAGGVAQSNLYQGDKILSVNGQDMTRATHRQAAAALRSAGKTITVAAQYLPDQYQIIRAKIRALHAAPLSPQLRPRSPMVQVHAAPRSPDLHQHSTLAQGQSHDDLEMHSMNSR